MHYKHLFRIEGSLVFLLLAKSILDVVLSLYMFGGEE